jgi:hypothetical protein
MKIHLIIYDLICLVVLLPLTVLYFISFYAKKTLFKNKIYYMQKKEY